MSKQIVPEEVVRQWVNDWIAMGELRPALSKYIANRAAAWAFEQAAKELDEKARSAHLVWKDSGVGYYEGFGDAMDEAANDLRALIGEGGKDGQC